MLLVGALAATVAVVVAGVFGGRDLAARASRAVVPDVPGAVLLVPGYGGSVSSLVHEEAGGVLRRTAAP